MIPGILEKTPDAVRAKMEAIEGHVAWMQLDVLDGTLYKNRSWFDAQTFAQWDTRMKIELHLMVKDPATIIRAWSRVKAFRRAVWHIEAPIDHHALIRRCHKLNLMTGLALAPETPIETVKPFLADIDRVFILGVRPGKSGQKLLPQTIKKVQALHAMAPALPIAFDGGITARNISLLARAGVSHFCVTSALFNHPPIHKRLQFLRGQVWGQV